MTVETWETHEGLWCSSAYEDGDDNPTAEFYPFDTSEQAANMAYQWLECV